MRPLFLAFLTTLLAASSAWAAVLGPHVLSALVQRPADTIPVIITLKPDPDQAQLEPLAVVPMRTRGEVRRQARMKHLQRHKQRSAIHRRQLRTLLKNNNITRVKTLWLIDSLAAELPPDLIDQVARQPEVLSISYDRLISPPDTPAPVPLATTAASNLSLIKAPDLWNQGLTAQNTTIALMDTGADSTHPDLQPNYRGGSNSWFNAIAANGCSSGGTNGCNFCDANTSQPCDSDGHGTAVAGILVGGSGSGEAIGVAPNAHWIATKIFKSDGSRTPESTIHQAFAWTLDPDGIPATDDAPDVLNASWGFSAADGCLLTFQADVQSLRNAGIAVVFSAGNDGPGQGTDVSPANNVNSYAVGSVGDIGNPTLISDFSSRGPSACDGGLFPDLVAPGFEIPTTDLSPLNAFPYIQASGTSFSAPHITGTMALLLGSGGFPNATVKELEDALRLSATDLGPTGPDNDYGYGLVDAVAAYNILLPPVATPLTPTDGGQVSGPDVTLTWRQPADALGAQVNNTILLDTNPGFGNPASYPVAATSGLKVSSYTMFGLAALLLPLGLRKKIRTALLLGLSLSLFAILLSCGGGGGSGSPAPDTTLRSLKLTGLNSGTVFYWKVQSETPRGGQSGESTVRSFTTK